MRIRALERSSPESYIAERQLSTKQASKNSTRRGLGIDESVKRMTHMGAGNEPHRRSRRCKCLTLKSIAVSTDNNPVGQQDALAAMRRERVAVLPLYVVVRRRNRNPCKRHPGPCPC